MATPQTTAVAGFTGDDLVDGLTTGYSWLLRADRTIDWSFSNGFSGEYWTDPASVQTHINQALSTISQYADVKFHYLGYYTSPSIAASAGSEINVSIDAANRFFTANNQWSRGLFPSTAMNSLYSGAPGDIYLNANSNANTLVSYDPGSVGWAVLLHEIGHALGLKHPFDDGGTAHPTFDQIGLSDQDTNLWTMMSYTDTYDWNQISWHPATPMVLDVIALQALYGKNMSTNAGDTVYDLKETNEYVTIWDAGGHDTVDLEHAARGWDVALPYVRVSSLVDTKVGFALPDAESQLTQPHTMDWLTGDIENVVGSSFSDLIFGNDLGNSIFAGVGDDTVEAGSGSNVISGFDGADSIVGGSGFDDINGNKGADTVDGGVGGDDSLQGGQGNDIVTAHAGTTWMNGNIGNDTVIGGVGDDVVRGGQDNDTIDGGAGNDNIYGDRGDDTLRGGQGADTFHIAPAGGHDQVVDFHASEGDRVSVDGSAYTIATSGSDTLIILSTGEQLTLTGVSPSSLPTGWIIST